MPSESFLWRPRRPIHSPTGSRKVWIVRSGLIVIHSSGSRYWAAMLSMSPTVARSTNGDVSTPSTIRQCIRNQRIPGAPVRYPPPDRRSSTALRKPGTPMPGMEKEGSGSAGNSGGSSSTCAVMSTSTGFGESATRILTEVARATSVLSSTREARTTWRRRPSRSTSTSGVSVRIGTPRISSTVWRQNRMGVAVGTNSTKWARMPETAPPCWCSGSHGPPQSGPGTSRSSSNL